jgi:flagellar biosynthesis protein FliR
MMDWTTFLNAMVLALVRVSGVVMFAPLFSSAAFPVRTKAVFAGAVAFLLTPVVAALPQASAEISFAALLGELAVGLVYGLTLALLSEMLLFAGQIVGLQFSFSLVNLMDPTTPGTLCTDAGQCCRHRAGCGRNLSGWSRIGRTGFSCDHAG